ncbi:hypothetical protein ACFW2Y_06385 [Streptomyces sp. NPDC058877]|uniref:hypothetical protein n=1 Tax=unclassified Streptomyces TaxID=2593676 RepID=UPI0036B931E6
MVTQKVRRTLLVVLLSHDSRTILLERQPGRSVWWPLRVDVPPHRSYARTAHRWQRRHGRRAGMRRGSVTGVLTVRTSTGCFEYRLIIIKLARSEAAEVFSPSARWWPIADVVAADLFPRELGILMTGYVEGWIPDGSITLEA